MLDYYRPMQQEKSIETPSLPENLIFSAKKARVRPKYNNQGEVRKMKLLIDLNKEETESFMALADAVKPEEVPLDAFVKSMFVVGINHYIERIQEEAAKVATPESTEAPEVEVITPNEQ